MANVAFWNLQNLFDTTDDPIAADFDFVPDKGWITETKDAKIANLAAVLGSMFGGAGPDLLGVCEVETNQVLSELVAAVDPSGRLDIAQVSDGPDIRGIDCGLVYDTEVFTVVDFNEARDGEPPTSSHLVHNRYPTRDVLEVALRLNATGEELLVYVNHWPSRSRGRWETEPLRVAAANHLGRLIDRRLKFTRQQLADMDDTSETAERIQARWNRNVLVMGDFNDEPFDRSVREELGASSGFDRLEQSVRIRSGANLPNLDSYAKLRAPLFNCMWPETAEPDRGTYHYPPAVPTFNMLDQIIVSRGLYYGHTGLRMTRNTEIIDFDRAGGPFNPAIRPITQELATVNAKVFDSDLMAPGSKHRPKRFTFNIDDQGQVTHNGDTGGTSDHFPIVTSFDAVNTDQ